MYKTQIFNAHLNPTSNTYVLDTDNTTPLQRAINQWLSPNIFKTIQMVQSQSAVVTNSDSTTSTTNITVTFLYS